MDQTANMPAKDGLSFHMGRCDFVQPINGALPLVAAALITVWPLIVPPAPVVFNGTGYMYFTRVISNKQD